MMKTKQHGFTLLELLLALAVSGLLISLAYGSIVLGQRSAHALQQKVEHSNLLLIGWQFLEDAIREARPTQNPDDPDDRTGFSGDAETLTFVANLPAYARPGGLTRIEFGLQPRQSGQALVLQLAPFPPLEWDQEPAALRQATLVDDTEYLEIAYLGKTENGTAEWRGEWSDATWLPNLVRIKVKPVGGAAWPVLIFRPWQGFEPLGNLTGLDRPGT